MTALEKRYNEFNVIVGINGFIRLNKKIRNALTLRTFLIIKFMVYLQSLHAL